MKKKIFALMLALLGATSLSAATMKEIMADLGKDANRLQSAILVDDYTAAAKAAEAIVEHPKPPLEFRKALIKSLGAEAADFKTWDHMTHHGAEKAKEAADSADRKGLQEAYQDMLKGCFGCHHNFRDRLK